MQSVIEPDDKSASAAVDRIVQHLEDDIVLGRLRPRERLLEQELAEHFNTKRHIVRAALAELETLGIVVRQPNRGAAVKDFAPDEVEQIYAVRQLLEGYAASIMPLPGDPEIVRKLRSIQQRHNAAVDEHQPRLIFRANLEFHRTLFGACGNPYLVDQINQLASRAHGIRFHAISDPGLVSRAREEHERMIDHIEKGEREALVALVAEHIKPSKDAYLRFADRAWAAGVR